MSEKKVDDALAEFLMIPGDPAKITDDDRRQVWEQIRAKRWSELGVIESFGRLLFPSFIWKRDVRTGEFVGDKIMIRVPRGDDLRKARVEARKIATDEKLDLDRDKDQVDDLETLCILWAAIRSPTEPFEPLMMDARDLEKRYDRPALEHVNFIVSQMRRVIDPHVSGMDAEELAALTAAIVERGNIVPLAAFDGATQSTFIVTLARLHQSFLMAKSLGGSQEPSTAGSSLLPSSELP